MNTLFVWPNINQFGHKPISISLLSALCKREGHNVDLFDTTYIDLEKDTDTKIGELISMYKPVYFDSTFDKVKVDVNHEFLKKIKTFQPDILAFSVLESEYPLACKLAETAKKNFPKIPIVIGNKAATICPEEVIAEKHYDFVCVGEGDEAFLELINAIDHDKNVFNIPNIWTKHNGKIIKNKVRALTRNLDSLPFLDLSIYDKRHFLIPFDGKKWRNLEFMSNWGCVYKCSYCVNEFLHNLNRESHSGFIRRFCPERAIKELKFHKENYAINFIKFVDEDFLMRSTLLLREFARLYVKEVGLPFLIETNPRSVNKEKVEILSEMGCVSVSMGVESGNSYTRSLLNRKDTKKDIIQAFELFHDAGIRSCSYIMLGLPFENREKIFESIRLLKKAKVKVPSMGFFYPFKGTAIRDVCIKNGFFDPKNNNGWKRNEPGLDNLDISRSELTAIFRNFVFYVKFPQIFWPLIKRTELQDRLGQYIYSILAKVYRVIFY
ncbi:MAG: B12-binding domain-containing radical SAM protein [Candidatus Scalinduaceae bacterium]